MSVKISACTIAKNEEKNIARSIESYKNYVDEIIIVDTGSTDNTVSIAESLGAKVIHFEWINDFSAARNCALDASTGDWILFLDADEWIKDDGASKLQSIIKDAKANNLNAVSFRMMNLEDDGTLFEITSSLRLFAHKPNIRYIRKIHEHLTDINSEKNLVSLKSEDLVLNHSGYANSVNKSKLKRNKELLEKNYMEGNCQGIDYFYLARENTTEFPEYARQFLDLLINDKEKMEETKRLDIANNIYDLQIKITKILENKYSFEERLAIIDAAINRYPDNPTYYFFKYVLLANSGRYDELALVNKAIELDENYENNAGTNNNSFARYRADALYELSQECFRQNDTLKALEYLVKAVQSGQMKEEILRNLLYIIGTQELSEKITFLNSLFDINQEDILKFVIQTLRLTQHTDIFLYYFVKYYKNFGEVDVSLFTSMLANKKYEEAADKYLAVLLNEDDKRAERMVVAAILAGELKEYYEKNKVVFSGIARKFVSAYFEETVIEDITEKDEHFICDVLGEILYVSPKHVLENVKKCVGYKENILRFIIRKHYSNKNYKELLSEINTFIQNDLSDEFAGEVTAKLGEYYYTTMDFGNAKLYFDQAIEVGFLDLNLARTYEYLMKKVQVNEFEKSKFETYKNLLSRLMEASNYSESEKIADINSELTTKNVEDFAEIVDDKINLTERFANIMFNYANKLFGMGNLYSAEEYYKILVRANYSVGKCYYNLGKIYNKLGAIELSYYCYDKAFRTAIDFPTTVLPKEHKNKYYIYNLKLSNKNEICPICGGEGELKYCYEYIEDENLSKDSALIVKYRYCEDCNHIFAENRNEDIKSVVETNNKTEYVFNANDIKDKLADGSKLVVVAEDDLMKKVFEEDFDTVHINESFEKTIDLSKLLKEIDKERTLITVINNANNVLNEDANKPLWANVDIVNVYSKQSIKKLLKYNGYTNIKIYDSKFITGKMTVVASKL